MSIKRGSIYTIKLLRRGVDIAGGLEQNILRSLKVRDFMKDQFYAVPESMKLLDLLSAFKKMDAPYLHVLNKKGELSGIISFRDIRTLLQEEELHHLIVAKDVASTDLLTITPEDNLLDALHKISRKGISQLPVVEVSNSKKLIGTLRHKDILSAYDNIIQKREES